MQVLRIIEPGPSARTEVFLTMETLLQPLTYITILISSFSGRKFTTVYMIYFKKTVFSPNIPTLIYKTFHLCFIIKDGCAFN